MVGGRLSLKKYVNCRMNNETHSNGPQLDDEILADPEVMAAIKENGNVEKRYDINNVQRTLLGRVGGCVAKHHGDFGFSGSLTFNLFVSLPGMAPSCAIHFCVDVFDVNPHFLHHLLHACALGVNAI